MSWVDPNAPKPDVADDAAEVTHDDPDELPAYDQVADGDEPPPYNQELEINKSETFGIEGGGPTQSEQKQDVGTWLKSIGSVFHEE